MDPEQRPRVAVVGCGMWGRNHVRTLAGLGALCGVVDARAEAADALAREHGAARWTLDEMLRRDDVDAVVVATPAADHADVALRCIDAGLDVLVEKPLALTTADAVRLIDAAQAADRVLMVGHLLHYHPAFLRLRDLVDTGALGQLRYLYSNRLNLGRFRQEENSLWSFAPHDISMILALVRSEPASVTATGASYLNPSIPDVTTTHLTFATGPSAHVFVSWLHPFKEQRLVVVGSDAMAVFDDLADWPDKLRVYEHGVAWREGTPVPVRAEATGVPLEPCEPLRAELEHFLDCVRTRERPRTDGAEGLAVLRVLDTAQASLETVRSPQPAQPDGVQVHPSAVVDNGAVVGTGTAIWHFSHVLDEVVIGRDCSLGQNVMVGPRVTIGDGCRIQNNVSVFEGVTLEDGVFCGPSSVFTNVLTPRAGISRRDEFAPTLVARGATIGANATIVCGSTIGTYAFVGAGAVVTRDVPAHALVVGNPARQVGWMSHDGERLGDDLVCPRSGRRYAVIDGHLIEQGAGEEGIASSANGHEPPGFEEVI